MCLHAITCFVHTFFSQQVVGTPRQETEKRKPMQELPDGWKIWNANSAAAKAIQEGLANENIDLNATPKQVWESNPLFQEYKLDTSANGLNSLEQHQKSLARACDGMFNAHFKMRLRLGQKYRHKKESHWWAVLKMQLPTSPS
jgi:NADH dehydrogenase/NADH:ubiquinone oxidoreductase subunit G